MTELIKPEPTVTTVNKRECSNCFFNPRGDQCQRNPMHTHVITLPKGAPAPGLALPGGGQRMGMQLMHNIEGLQHPTSPDYCCFEHRYAREVKGWHWDDPMEPEPIKLLAEKL